MENFALYLTLVRSKSPLVLQITNAVTINDCANITICAGASPVMSNSEVDAVELVSAAGALVLNIGTADEEQLNIMRKCAKKTQNIPTILDPVGAGATTFRTKNAKELMQYASVIKGNAGEIAALAGEKAEMKGVDSCTSSENIKDIAKKLAASLNKIVIVSGKEDIVTDGKRTVGIANGVELMEKVSGTGCMASAVCAAFAAAGNNTFAACVSAMTYLGLAGEKAASAAKGPASFKTAYMDAVAVLTEDDFKNAKITEYP